VPQVSDWRSKAELASLRMRAEVYRLIREFFFERGVMEVETPILSHAGNSDPNIESFHLEFDGPASAGARTRWLRTSPEFPLKRLLASGIGDCYELGRVFRNGEFGRKHNPEFSMLEWYRVGWSHLELIEECVTLVQKVFSLRGVGLSVMRTSYRELFQRQFGFDPHAASTEQITAAVTDKVSIDTQGLQRDDLLDLLLSHVIEPSFPDDQLTVILDFPASQCALARIRTENGLDIAERFELYVGGFELANGYHELTDACEQRKRFEADLEKRRLSGKILPALDARLLAAMPSLPPCAGVAMGLDRLMMRLLGKQSMADVIGFDFSVA
jgi:lysyl-tRNA synthetase class 2